MVNTPYDDVFRTLLNDCTELVIPLVNTIFGEDYSGKEQIVTFQNELFMMRQDGDTKEKITDTCFVIISKIQEKNKKYHLECQSSPDGSMLIRMVEYDTQIALEDGELENSVLTIRFPNSAVIYLRHTSHTPDVFKVRMLLPEGEATYRIPVMKVQQYTIDEVFEKKLLFLIPFYIFSYEKSFEQIERDKERLEKLEEEYILIRKRLEEMCTAGEINEYIKCTLLDMTKKVIDSIAKKYENVREGVKQVVGGKILEYEAKDILRRGMQEGLSQGRQEGQINMCIRLIQDGLLKVEDAARKLNMDEEELKKYL